MHASTVHLLRLCVYIHDIIMTCLFCFQALSYRNGTCTAFADSKGHGEVIHIVFHRSGVSSLQSARCVVGNLVQTFLSFSIRTGLVSSPYRHLVCYCSLCFSTGPWNLPTGQKKNRTGQDTLLNSFPSIQSSCGSSHFISKL